MFDEKLDFIMNLTEVSNSSLARAVVLDPSYISRLRTGKRKLPNKQDYLILMSEYFAYIIAKNEKMKSDFNSVLSLYYDFEIDNSSGLNEIIYDWLSSETDDHVLDSLKTQKYKEEKVVKVVKEEDTKCKTTHFYYGSEGKREACIRFLNDILKTEHPTTIYLYSEENMEWLYEDTMFNSELSSLLKSILNKKFKIKIIHNMRRNLNEIYQALNTWIPIYLSGTIESNYYPLIRDDIYRRTLFIAPGISAISSISVKDRLDNMMNLYTTDKLAIKSLLAEYNNYFALCTPLINSYSIQKDPNYIKRYLSSYEKLTTTCVQGLFPSISTMPDEVVENFSKAHKSSIRTLHNSLSKSFLNLVKTNRYIELVVLPDITTVHTKKVIVPESVPLLNKNIYYGGSELKKHLELMIHYLKKYENYIVLIKDMYPNDASYIGKIDANTAIFSTSEHGHIMYAVEQNLSIAMCQYIKTKLATINYDREETIKILKDYIDLLGSY